MKNLLLRFLLPLSIIFPIVTQEYNQQPSPIFGNSSTLSPQNPDPL
jgi:hypothetical protein